MAPFGARPHFPTYVGGGDLWEEPIPERRAWWDNAWVYPTLGAIAWLFIVLACWLGAK